MGSFALGTWRSPGSTVSLCWKDTAALNFASIALSPCSGHIVKQMAVCPAVAECLTTAPSLSTL